MNLTRLTRTLICAALLVLSSGCAQQSAPDSAASSAAITATGDPASVGADTSRATMGAPQRASASLVATGIGETLDAYEDPGGDKIQTFDNPTPTGVPLTFMVISTDEDWTQVQLPIRPNSTNAWVSTEEVTITEVSYALKVSTKDNTLELYRHDELIESFPVATGTGGTPTPTGTFFLTELITPTNEGYGPFAYGISAFSEEITSFGGGPGQIGLHGTDDTGSIGRAASHGCIRMTNPAITKLSALLPLGTPIEIS